jgi:hypothetical protein
LKYETIETYALAFLSHNNSSVARVRCCVQHCHCIAAETIYLRDTENQGFASQVCSITKEWFKLFWHEVSALK